MKSEKDIIALLQKILPQASAHTLVGIGDDAAVLRSSKHPLVLSTDAMVEGIHFDWQFCEAGEVGYKALATSLSDLAAMAARPRAALLSLALPETLPDEKLIALIEGMADCAREFAIDLVGGNLSRSRSELQLHLTVVGECAHSPILRSGLKPGDWLAVTGPLGLASLGLSLLARLGRGPALDQAPESTLRYLKPKIRLPEALSLLGSQALTAAIDISDSFASACWSLAEASQVELFINSESLPLAHDAGAQAEGQELLTHALFGGGDYELLLGLNPFCWQEWVCQDLARKDLIHVIGEVSERSLVGVRLLAEDGSAQDLPNQGWDHFATQSGP